MEKLLVNTPQNVNIEYSLASVGSRILAIGLDYVIMISYVILMVKFMDLAFRQTLDSWDYFGLLILFLLPVLFYHLWMETYFQGQTLGMKVLKLKVVKLDGSRATIYEYFIRWAMNLVDVWMLSGLIGLMAIVLSKKSQRIGDLAAGTTVISLKPRLNLIETVYEDLKNTYVITYPQVIKLTDKDINIIKSSYTSAMKKGDIAVIQKLGEKIKNVLEIQEIKGDYQTFIQTVIQDHYQTFR